MDESKVPEVVPFHFPGASDAPTERTASSADARPLLPPVDGVVIAWNDVLVDASSWRRWLQCILRQRGFDLATDELWALWRVGEVDVFAGRRSFSSALIAFLQSLGLEEGEARELAAAVWGQTAQWDAEVRLFPQAADFLKLLRSGGLRTVVLADSVYRRETFVDRFSATGVFDLIDAVCLSRESGFALPEAGAFAAAWNALGLPPTRTAFVARRRDDLEAAYRLGMVAIAVSASPVSGPFYQASCLTEVGDWLLAPGSRRGESAAG
ncbi:MAG: hypothetical protein D6741_16100 [Planctomycetota bacterium]|nr:MAG: hypothetical protein D6741_16100 [Planctomycetota bacterium]